MTSCHKARSQDLVDDMLPANMNDEVLAAPCVVARDPDPAHVSWHVEDSVPGAGADKQIAEAAARNGRRVRAAGLIGLDGQRAAVALRLGRAEGDRDALGRPRLNNAARPVGVVAGWAGEPANRQRLGALTVDPEDARGGPPTGMDLKVSPASRRMTFVPLVGLFGFPPLSPPHDTNSTHVATRALTRLILEHLSCFLIGGVQSFEPKSLGHHMTGRATLLTIRARLR